MAQIIQLRNGTATEWTNANPILSKGEVGIETDTYKMKVGDGALSWTNLPYTGAGGPTGPAGDVGPTGPAGVDGAVPATGYPGRILLVQSGGTYPTPPNFYKEFLGSATPPSTNLLNGDLWTQAGGAMSVSCTGFTAQTAASTTQGTWTMPSDATSGKVVLMVITMATSFSGQTATLTINGVSQTPVTTVAISGYSQRTYSIAGGAGIASQSAVFSWTGAASLRTNVSGVVISGVTSSTPAYSSAPGAPNSGSSRTASPTVTNAAIGTVEFSVTGSVDSTTPYTGTYGVPAGLALQQATYYNAASPGQCSAIAANLTPLAGVANIGNRVWTETATDSSANTTAYGATTTIGYAVSGGSAARFIYDGANWATGPGL